MKVLVTGGAGFIGSHLVDELIKDNEVIVIDNFSTGKKENLAHLRENNMLTIHEGDICEDIVPLLKDVEIVFHPAARPRVQFSIDNPKLTHEANITGTLNILEACRKADVKKLIYSSSSSVYGEQPTLPLKETMKPNPMSPYGLQKLASENYCKVYNDVHGIKTINLRYFNVFGPRMDPTSDYACLIPKSINLVNQGKSPIIYGDGEQTRDFTFVRDVVQANIKASQAKAGFGEVFNIGNGRNLSVNHVVKTIIGDKDIKPIHTAPVVEAKHTLADISKAEKILGWKPKHRFEEGLKITADSLCPTC